MKPVDPTVPIQPSASQLILIEVRHIREVLEKIELAARTIEADDD